MDGHAIIPEGIEAGHALPIIIADDARAKLHPHSGSLYLDFHEEIHMFMDQANEVICQTVQENNPQELRDSMEKILDDLQEDFTRYLNPDETPGAETTNPPAHELLRPMIQQLNRLAGLMMGNEEIQIQIQDMIEQLKINIRISQNCWILKFSRSQLPRFMEKSREILNKAGKILFKELTERIRDKSKDSPDKYDCITKVIDGFKSCCYLELEVKVTDLLEPKPENREVVVRILGSWEIKKTASEEKNLDQFIQTLSEQGKRLQPDLEPILRGLHSETGEQTAIPSTSRKRSAQKEASAGVEDTRPKKIRRYSDESTSIESGEAIDEQTAIQSTSRKRSTQEEPARVDTSRKERMRDSAGSQSTSLKGNDQQWFLEQLTNLRLKGKLTKTSQHCQLLFHEYRKRDKAEGSTNLNTEYTRRIKDYLYDKLNGKSTDYHYDDQCKDLADTVTFYLNSGRVPDEDTQVLIARLWKPLCEIPSQWPELCCQIFDDDNIFIRIFKQLRKDGGKLLQLVKNSKPLLLNPKSHLLVETLRKTKISFSDIHETLAATKDGQGRTCLFSTGSSEPFTKIYVGHTDELYELLMLTDNNRQTALHVNTECIAWMVTSTYLPRHFDRLCVLLSVTDSNNQTAMSYKQQFSVEKSDHYAFENKPTVLIFASYKNDHTRWQLASKLCESFKSVGSYNIQLEKDKNETEIIGLINQSMNKRDENQLPPSTIMVMLISPNLKESSSRASINLKKIETAMCEADELKDTPKLLISEYSDLEKTPYVLTNKHFGAVLYPTAKGKLNMKQHFIHHLSEQLQSCTANTPLESVFKTIQGRMVTEMKIPGLLPVMMSTLVSDFYPVYQATSTIVSSAAPPPEHPNLLSWLTDQVANKRYLIPYDPTVLIFFMSKDRKDAEDEALSIYNALESTDLYNVRLHEDKSKPQIIDLIKSAAERRDKYSTSPPSALLVYIMSRGEPGVLEDCNGEAFEIKTVEEAMCSSASMIGRPKILVIQSSQLIDTENMLSHDMERQIYAPTHDHFFAVMSSTFAETSLQNIFIPMLANQIEECKGTKSFDRMIRQASKDMEKETSQTPIIMSTLKAQFCPGNRIPLHLRI